MKTIEQRSTGEAPVSPRIPGFSRSPRAEDYAKKFIKDHGLAGCGIAMEIVSCLRQIDRYLLMDKVEGWINWPTTEFICRKAYGLERAFGRRKVTSDWLKPKNAGKHWKSKVDWTAAD